MGITGKYLPDYFHLLGQHIHIYQVSDKLERLYHLV